MEEEVLVKTVLNNLRGYILNHLTVGEDFISDLSAAELLDDTLADRLRSLVALGGNEALYHLLHYMELYYDAQMLVRFCVFLENKAKPAKPLLGRIAKKIRQELKKLVIHVQLCVFGILFI